MWNPLGLLGEMGLGLSNDFCAEQRTRMLASYNRMISSNSCYQAEKPLDSTDKYARCFNMQTRQVPPVNTTDTK
jgi:hypothetical protein